MSLSVFLFWAHWTHSIWHFNSEEYSERKNSKQIWRNFFSIVLSFIRYISLKWISHFSFNTPTVWDTGKKLTTEMKMQWQKNGRIRTWNPTITVAIKPQSNKEIRGIFVGFVQLMRIYTQSIYTYSFGSQLFARHPRSRSMCVSGSSLFFACSSIFRSLLARSGVHFCL